MNEEAFQDLYTLFVNNGYRKSKAAFITLLNENDDAYSDAFEIFQNAGYSKGEDEFATLIGIERPLKKKPEPVESPVLQASQNDSTDLLSEDGSSEQPESEDEDSSLVKVNKVEDPVTKSDSVFNEYADYVNTFQGTPEYSQEKADSLAGESISLSLPDFNDPKAGIYGNDTRSDDYRAPSMPMYADELTQARYYAQLEADRAVTLANILKEAPELENQQLIESQAQNQLLDIQEQERLGNIQSQPFKDALSTVDSSLIDQEEEQVVPFLREQFRGFGFTFQETGVGDAMIVTAPNGATITIDLDPFTSATEVAESNKLRSFLTANATLTPQEAYGSEVNNAMRLKQSRDTGLRLEDGSYKYFNLQMYQDSDGSWKVIPTLFPSSPEKQSSDRDNWIAPVRFSESKEIAKERGEVYSFDNKADAEAFMNGSWKDVNTLDAEGVDFYNKRGLDYNREQKIYNEYMDATDIMFFLDPDRDGYAQSKDAPFLEKDLTDQKKAELQKMGVTFYIDGQLRGDIQNLLDKAEATADRLSDEFLREDAQLAREEYDLYLNKRHQKEAGEAIRLNQRVKGFEDNILKESLQDFGVLPEELIGVTFDDPLKNQRAKDIVNAYAEVGLYKEIAADKYYKANTYFDMKHNKAAAKEYADNWESFTTEWSGGLARGKAGDVILAGAMFPEILGGYNLEDPNSTAEMAEKLVQYLSDEPEKVSRVMTRYSMARTSAEISNVIWSDPFEWATSLAAGSISQMLPYGSKIVATTTATGAGTGALIGAPAGGVGAIPGAVTGATWGFRTGMAMTSLAMEYTNEMMMAIEEYCQSRGGSSLDPLLVQEALEQQSVWDKGRERGLKRGIPIAMVDMFTGSMAGKILKTGSVASKGTKALAWTTERALVDPFAEGVGEYLAQKNVGDDINWKEIYAEAGGAVGNNTSNLAVNTLQQTYKKSNIELAQDLTNINLMINESSSDSRISDWANNLNRLGQIDDQTNQRIQENVGLRKTAKELLNTGRLNQKLKGKNTRAVEGRLMKLLAAKQELTSSQNRKEVFSGKVAEINKEIQELIQTKEVRAPENQTLLAGIGVLGPSEQAGPTDVRSGLPKYVLKKNKFGRPKQVTKQEFLDYINGLDKRRLGMLNATVSNDEEVTEMLTKKIIEAKLETKIADESNANNQTTTSSVSTPTTAETTSETSSVSTPTTAETSSDVVSDIQQTVAEDGVSSKTLDNVEAQVTNEQAAETTQEQPITTQEQEVQDLESRISEVESGTESSVDFRTKPEEETNIEDKTESEVEVTTTIDAIESPNTEATVTNEELQSSEPINIKELNKRTDRKLKPANMSVVKGVPTIFSITDQLTTGNVTNPKTGNEITDLKGAIGFNGTVGNENAAWANTTYNKAEDLIKKATRAYVDNEQAFKDFWAKNPEYNGLVPMNIVKMGEGSMRSNEAVFRVLADNLSLVPESNLTSSVRVLKKETEEIISRLKKRKPSKSRDNEIKEHEGILEALDKNNITNMMQVVSNDFISQLQLPVRSSLIKILTTGKPTPAKTPSKKVSKNVAKSTGATVKALLRNTEGQADILNLGVITDLITDPQLKNVPIGNIVSLVGIDVLNPEVLETNHPNYKYGPKGKSIGILENPVPVEKTYPEAYKKIISKFIQKEEGGKTIQDNTTRTQELNVSGGLAPTEFIGMVTNSSVENLDKLNAFMNLAFPSVVINSDVNTFDNVMSQDGVKKYLKGDEIIYGVTVDGDIYINPEAHQTQSSLFNTAIHEMGHIWTDYLQTTEKGRSIYKKGAELVQQTEEFKKQLKAFDGNVEKATREAMAILIGNKGETIVNGSIKSKFKEWLVGLWNYVKSQFKMSKDLTADEVQELTLDKFLQTALADIFSGKEIKLTEQQKQKLKNPDAAFREGMSMQGIIQEGRRMGMEDDSIKVVLKNRGFKARDINQAMVVQIDLIDSMPKEFGNAEGGANVGFKLYTEVKEELDRFARSGPRGGRTNRRTKTFGEIRQKAQELLMANPIFQIQDEQTQLEMRSALDRDLGYRSNPNISKVISDIRKRLKERKIGKNNLKDAQRRMRTIIRQLLPKSKNYSNTVINRLLKLVNETNDKNFKGQMEGVLNEVENQREILRGKVIEKIISLVNKKSKTNRTRSGKRRSAGLDALGQSYFKQAKRVLDAALKRDLEAMQALNNEVNPDIYNELIAKVEEGQKLTTKEKSLLDLALALDTFQDVLNMNLEEVNDLFEEVKLTRKESIDRLNNRRAIRKQQTQEIKDALNNQMQEDYSELYTEDGKPLDRNDFRSRKERIRLAFKNNGVFAAVKEFGKQFVEGKNKFKRNALNNFFIENLAHLGTITNILDRGQKKLFTKLFYDNLNIMDENNLIGVREVNNDMDAMARSINKKDWSTWKYSLGNDIIEIEGIESTTSGNVRTEALNKDQAMRIIALYMNETQKKKLLAQGFTQEKIDQLKTFVGKDNVSLVEQVVEYLSNPYYESVNKVYSQVNDVNLGFVENYFPTQTISRSEVTASMLGDADIQKIFTAEFSPALKERIDRESDVALGFSFSEVMEEHIRQMEKYKSYAEGVKTIDNVLKDAGVKNLLRESGLQGVFARSLNYAINPEAGPPAPPNIINKLQNKFTGFALAFKLIQIPKQMTSFIQAYEVYGGKGKRKIPGQRLVNFMMDYAYVIATLPKQIKEARQMSASFDNRIKQGLEGDITGLESGSRTIKKRSADQGRVGRFSRAFKRSAGFTTVAGDILGVLGYKAAYNKAIRDGMNQAEALRLFNEYNSTQQSRRATEKNSLQQSNDWKARAFTMFGSTLFLQQNKIYQSMNGIMKDASKGKVDSQKIKSFALNYAVANVLFTMASYSSALMSGSSDDRARAWKAVRDAALGKNLIIQFPLIGTAIEEMLNQVEGERRPTSDVVNPFTSVYYKIMKAYKGLDEGSIMKVVQPMLEISIGAQLDSFTALAELFTGTSDDETMYDLFGISRSYRPGYGSKEKKKITAPKSKKTNKSTLKQLDQDVYNELYGPGSDYYEIQKEKRNLRKEIKKEIEDAMK